MTCFFLLNNLLPETWLELLGEIQIWSSLGVKGLGTIEQSVIWLNTSYTGMISHFRWFLRIALPIKPVIWCKLWPWHRWFENLSSQCCLKSWFFHKLYIELFSIIPYFKNPYFQLLQNELCPLNKTSTANYLFYCKFSSQW